MQLTDPKGRLHTITLERRQASSTPTAATSPTTTSSARPTAPSITQHRRRRVPRAAAAARRLRHVDAARRGRRLPQGRRPDRHDGRHLPRRRASSRPVSGRGALSHVAAARRRRAAAGCTRSSAARTSPTSPGATSGRSSAATTPPGPSPSATSSSPCRRRVEAGIGRPRRPGHARPVGVPRRRRRRARARRRAHLLRRHADPAVPGGRGDPRPRRLHRAAGLGVAGARLAPRGPGGAARSTGCTATPASSSPPGGWPPASPRRCASAVRPRARTTTRPTRTPGADGSERRVDARGRRGAAARRTRRSAGFAVL